MGALILCLAGGTGYSAYLSGLLNPAAAETENKQTYKETQVMRGNLITGASESGSVSIGLVEQGFDIGSRAGSDSSADSGSSAHPSLRVESVQVSIGQRVKKGEALLKLSDESVSAGRKSLEEAVESAGLAVKKAQIERDENALKSDYEYKTNVAKGEIAQAEYDSTIAGLENQIAEIQTSIDKALKRIDDLTKRAAAGEKVENELQEQQEDYSELSAKLVTAQNNLITGRITAKQNYDLSMLNYENADRMHELDSSGLDSSLNSAKEALEAAEGELEAFEAFVGDGTIYSDYTGTVTELGFAQGDILEEGKAIAVFQNADEVTMEVSVNQEDIAAISVGDRVVIKLAAYEDQSFEGTVESIALSSDNSASAVSYKVTVRFTGDVSLVYADMTGSVTFVDKEAADVLYISNKAVYREGSVSYVKVLESDGSFRKTEVKTGFSDGYRVEIVSGLEEGQTVIIESRVSK